jgi:hypothetical protein
MKYVFHVNCKALVDEILWTLWELPAATLRKLGDIYYTQRQALYDGSRLTGNSGSL